jgi:23S rRNA (uracil1939-C5)-methyltransferase
VKAGDAVTVACDALDDEGAAAGAATGGDPARVHVAGALPGERVTAMVTHVSRHRPEAWASLREIEVASPARRAPACRAWGDCGGCVLQHLAYDQQVAWKTARVRAVAAAHAELAAVPVAPCVPSPRPLGYRNRSKLVCARAAGVGGGGIGAGPLVLGAFAPRSHVVIDLGGCRIAEPPLDDLAGALRAILEAAGVVPYDERTFTGDLRHAVLRVSHRGQVLVTLVTARRAWPAARGVADALLAGRPGGAEVCGVVQNVNPTRGNAIFGAEEIVLGGAATLDDAVGGVRVRLSSQSFFQANRDVAALAYAAIAATLAPAAGGDSSGSGGKQTGRLVDAYAGVGGIALTLAPHAREVIGIEAHPAAVTDAEASAALNGVTHARFVAGDAAARLREIDRADAVVLNPPRRGCDAAVLDEVARLAPARVAYLSCDPETLARDLVQLAGRGYKTLSLTPFDMLPHTPHIEVLAVLAR